MSGSVQPHRWQPTRLPHPWNSQVKNTGVGCHFLLQCMKVKSESKVAQLCLTLSDPMDCSSMEFSRKEYWSGVPLPSPLCMLHIIIFYILIYSHKMYQFSSIAQSCPTLYDPMDCSMPGFPDFIGTYLPPNSSRSLRPLRGKG